MKITEKGGIWERGGSFVTEISARIVTGPGFEKLRPIRTSDVRNGRHALMPAVENGHVLDLRKSGSGKAVVYIYAVRKVPGKEEISLKMAEYFPASEADIKCSGAKLRAVKALILKGKVLGCRRAFYAAAA